MKTKLAVLFCATCLSAAAANTAFAQGRGAGMGRGLGHAAAGGAAALGRAGSTTAIQNATSGAAIGTGSGAVAGSAVAPSAAHHGGRALPRDLSQMGGVAAGVSRGARGLERSSAALSGALPQQVGRQPSVGRESAQVHNNFDRIQQHRLQQAEHLRGIAERNGNEHLLDTADRMQANAIQNFQRQTGTMPPANSSQNTVPGQAPTQDLDVAPSVGTATTTQGTPTASGVMRARPTTTPKRGFWFRSR